MATYQFGAVGATNVAEGDYGLLQSFAENETADEAVAQDADGNVADQTIYNGVTEITCEYVFDTTQTPPSVGDEIVVGATDKYTVMSVGKTESNTDYKRVSLTLKRYTANGVPANA
jgi:hypothetical protein